MSTHEAPDELKAGAEVLITETLAPRYIGDAALSGGDVMEPQEATAMFAVPSEANPTPTQFEEAIDVALERILAVHRKGGSFTVARLICASIDYEKGILPGEHRRAIIKALLSHPKISQKSGESFVISPLETGGPPTADNLFRTSFSHESLNGMLKGMVSNAAASRPQSKKRKYRHGR